MERNYWILCADKEKWHPQMGNDFDSWEKWNIDIGYDYYLKSGKKRSNAGLIKEDDYFLVYSKGEGFIGIGIANKIIHDEAKVDTKHDRIDISPKAIFDRVIDIAEIKSNQILDQVYKGGKGVQTSFTKCPIEVFIEVLSLAGMSSLEIIKFVPNYDPQSWDTKSSLMKLDYKMPIDFNIDKSIFDKVYLPNSIIDRIFSLLKRKRNIILQGPPGVGKTFIAKKISEAISDRNLVDFVQFHQSYSYEDFVIGYKPNDKGGFELKPGAFYKACIGAVNEYLAGDDIESVNPHFFVIDEINRGNISKIFGELLMLIENNYRGQSIHLSNVIDSTDSALIKNFCVPPNLYIIGMMNTADRSLAVIDYALRRRFSFVSLKPIFDGIDVNKLSSTLNYSFVSSDSDQEVMFGKFLSIEKLDTVYGRNLIGEIIQLNDELRDEFGEGFVIGHSYFCNLNEEESTTDVSKDVLKDVIAYEIVPLLEEYWFDQPDRVKTWTERLVKALEK